MNHYRKRIRSVRSFSGACATLLLSIATLPVPIAAETVMVTGSNRGIGLEFVKQYAARGWTVIATHRRDTPPESLVEISQAHPGQITIEQMDVSDHGQIITLAEKLKGVPIDLIINNAALTSDFENVTRHSFGTLDHAQFESWMAVNAHGPLMVSEAFIENVKASEQKKIVSLTSLFSSFGRNLGRPGSFYWDKASKVALNAIMFNLSYDLKDDGVIVALVSPGIVRVEKTQHLPKRPNQIETHESVAGLIKVIDGLTMEKTGSFTRYNGNPVPF